MKSAGIPTNGTIDAAEFANVDAVVHLAGENIAAHRWTESFKDKNPHQPRPQHETALRHACRLSVQTDRPRQRLGHRLLRQPRR